MEIEHIILFNLGLQLIKIIVGNMGLNLLKIPLKLGLLLIILWGLELNPVVIIVLILQIIIITLGFKNQILFQIICLEGLIIILCNLWTWFVITTRKKLAIKIKEIQNLIEQITVNKLETGAWYTIIIITIINKIIIMIHFSNY